VNGYAEFAVDVDALHDAVARACVALEPLGAFADGDAVRYLFAGPAGVTALRCGRDDPQRTYRAAAGSVPLFDWHEREMRDAGGVAIADLPNPRASFADADGAPPALTVEGKGVSVIVVGPVHAGIIEPGRFTFSTGGETVIHLDVQLSYSRRGVERFLAGRDAVGAAPAVARICAACSAARSWAYARALEELAGVTCDERAEWARVVIAELERIYNHLFDLASVAAGAGYGYGQTHGLALKERVHQVCAAATGHRLLFDAIVPGGVRTGVVRDPRIVAAALGSLRADTAAYLDALFANRSVLSRFTGTGHLSVETARAFGATGPARRACGAAIDMRRLQPYGAYCDAAPAASCEAAGDVAARCRVKAAELADSFDLVERALRELGDAAPPPPAPLRSRSGAITTVVEGARGAESVSLSCDRRGRLTAIHVTSASYRNWPVVVRAMEGNIVPDFPLVNKSFNLCYACADR
jgi:Ni,Fe-hydrogenase III large subunit